MHSNYKRLRIKALSERGRKMAQARWAKDRAERDSQESEILHHLREIETINLPRRAGDMLGVMQWTCAATGKTRRWVIRIGERADRITVEAPGEKTTTSHGWEWFLSKLRKHLLGNQAGLWPITNHKPHQSQLSGS